MITYTFLSFLRKVARACFSHIWESSEIPNFVLQSTVKLQDDLDNVTRFLMLAREPIIPRVDRPFKVGIAFSACNLHFILL